MVCKQIDVMGQQGLQALLAGTDYPLIFTTPEISMMYQNGISTNGDGRLNQRQARCYAADHRTDVKCALHLQTVWAIVAKTGNIQRFAEIFCDFIPIYCSLIHFLPAMQRLWLLFAQTVTIGLALWFIVATLKPEWAGGLVHGMRGTHVTSTTVPMLEAPSTAAAPAAHGSYRDAAKRAMPAVVNIFTSKAAPQPNNPLFEDPFFRRFFGDQLDTPDEKQFSLGSGVIVSPQGYILTNNHVIETADEIEVALADGRKAVAKVVGSDPETDLAVIKIDLPNLPVITLGRLEQVNIGDVVLAIGNPFGVGETVTMGIVSALGRNRLGINTFENFIQTDAAINPGNSGGALIDTNGYLLGINTAIFSRSGGSLGIGFAIPVTTVKMVMDAIIADGQVIRGWIGVEPQDITPELAESFGLSSKTGAIIAGVLKNGPADKAGMRPGDILVAVENSPVTDTTDMLNLIAQLTPGEKSKMTVLRKNQQAILEVTVGKRPRPKKEPLVE